MWSKVVLVAPNCVGIRLRVSPILVSLAKNGSTRAVFFISLTQFV